MQFIIWLKRPVYLGQDDLIELSVTAPSIELAIAAAKKAASRQDTIPFNCINNDAEFEQVLDEPDPNDYSVQGMARTL